jgi:hypothetical protein
MLLIEMKSNDIIIFILKLLFSKDTIFVNCYKIIQFELDNDNDTNYKLNKDINKYSKLSYVSLYYILVIWNVQYCY